jgi:hypothetical protein
MLTFQTLFVLCLSIFAHGRPLESTKSTESGISQPVISPIFRQGSLPVDILSNGDRTRGQTQYLKHLRALYFYTCPVAGRMARDFEWQARFRLSDHQLFLDAIKNIGSLDKFVINKGSFWTVWRGYLCVPKVNQFCTYVFPGRTEGTIFDDGMILGLVTNTNIFSEKPEVTEICMDTTGLPYGTCPTIPLSMKPRLCVINHIDVQVLQ